MDEKGWVAYAEEHLLGKKVVALRYLTEAERDDFGWSSRALVIVFDDGSFVFPSRDDEGNDAGSLFGQSGDGPIITFPIL